MFYLKRLIFSMKEIIITSILVYVITILSALIYNVLGYNDVDNFINNILPFLLIIYYLIIIIYLYSKNYRKETKLPSNKFFPRISLGISIAIILNMIIFKIFPPPSVDTNISLLVSFISSGIVGPIYEEILFRYLLYNRIKEFNSQKKALLITTIIFASFHLTPIKIIYAFILGLILNIFYEKDKSIISPILIHISANSIVLLLTNYDTTILLLAILNLLISLKLIKRKNN